MLRQIPISKPTSLRLQQCCLSLACVFIASCGYGQAPAAITQQTLQLLEEAGDALSDKDYALAASKATKAAASADDSASVLQRSAEILFLAGKAAESLPLFDRVVELVPQAAPQNWQRGIALCTVGKFEEGAKQFKSHHDVNPDDVENSAWYFLCVAKTQGLEAARKSVIPSRGDGRQPMMSVLEMLQDRIKPDRVIEAAKRNTSEPIARNRALFYAELYIGLYYDSLDDAELAKEYLQRCLAHDVNGYMADTARVYLAERFPNDPSQKPVLAN